MSSRGERIKEIEEFPKRIKIFFIILASIFIIGTLGFMILSNLGVKEAFIKTLESLAFIFQEERAEFVKL